MKLSRIQVLLESRGFECFFNCLGEYRLSELDDYRKIYGCNVPRNYGENTQLSKWVEPKGTITGCTEKERNHS